MKLQIAICDDESSQIEYLVRAVNDWAAASGHSCEVDTFLSADAFLFDHNGGGSYNILLLDVEMPGTNGIDMAKELRRNGYRGEIIFITSHFEFYGEGYEVDALHYLIKPIAEDKLFSVLTKAAERLALEPASVIINCDGETVKLLESDILYVESALHYVSIRTVSGEYRIKESLSAFAERLSGDFYHAHRSYYVSLKHIVRISRTSVTLDRGWEIPLSRGKYDDINRAYIERN